MTQRIRWFALLGVFFLAAMPGFAGDDVTLVGGFVWERDDGKREGDLWFLNGSAVHAKSGSKTGVDAVDDMLRWKSGNFSIEHGVEAKEQTIDVDSTFLLMECLRKSDEEAARAAGIL